MEYVTLWFILTGGTGYIAPMEVRAPECGRPGLVVGLLVDRKVNPTTVYWPDPKTVGEHCRIDVRQRVAEMPLGVYHFATTEMGKARAWNEPVEPYIGIDPHTSEEWTRAPMDLEPPSVAPTGFRIR